MATELSRDELEALLGAYALDAADADERDQVEQYLERNPHAAALVDEYRETVALLAYPGTEPPPALRDRIEQLLTEEPPRLQTPPHPGAVTPGSRRTRSRRRIVSIAAVAAALLALITLSLRVVQQNHHINDITTRATSARLRTVAESASHDPRATNVNLFSADGSLRARIVYLPDGQGYLVDTNLTKLTRDRTYQLWALVGDPHSASAISAGVLGPNPNITAFKIRSPVVGFAITEEDSPGVVFLTNPALLQGTIS